MTLERPSWIPPYWILIACAIMTIFSFRLCAQEKTPQQDAPAPQESPQESPQPQETAKPQPEAPPEAAAQGAQQQPSPAQDAREEVEINDRTRTYVVHLPAGYDAHQQYPVVILFHGFDQDAAEMARLTRFNELADQDGIIAVYPNGLRGRWNLGGGSEPRAYRQGPHRRPGYPPASRPEPGDRESGPRNPDMLFLRRMLDRVATRYSMDNRRVYAVGMGEGGFMAIRMACTMADRVAGIAVVGTELPRMFKCDPSRPVPALLMSGTDDPIFPYDGGRYKDGMVRLLSAEDSAKEWARLNRCSDKPSESKLPALQEGGKDTKVYLFDGCQQNAQVVLYSVKDGGHTWPGGEQVRSEKEVGKTSNALNANENIWSFLVTKKIGGESGGSQK